MDGSKFTCTTCIVYQFFKELFFSIALRFKSGCKGKRFILKHQMFWKFFLNVFPVCSLALLAKGKGTGINAFYRESDCKDNEF
ncbi:hypothetical protein EC81_022095 [Bacteroides fragilis]|uniref:Transmembrane protein n=2 Tax=Bacteroides fragilis TaxID=817 RepID=A0AAE6K918_BACFG|nr:hypothetical protein EC80_021020 [Bacteroides fragilis]QCQ56786.1 hypothetical protein EC81_022095 [Bacteroides fragilis]